jgi:hypothetical protein
MQGNNDGGNVGGGDVVALVVTSTGVGRRNESGQGEEEDALMAADGYRQHSTKSSNGNGRFNGDSDDNGNRDGDGKGNSGMAMATIINNWWQQKKRWRSWQWWWRRKWRQGQK